MNRAGPARIAYVALGSNLEDPAGQVTRAFGELGALPGTRLLARSSLYRTAPVGYADQPDFINAAASISTTLEPHPLLEALLEIERAHGRRREFQNGPRTLDLDLLLYAEAVLRTADLTLPHPRMATRAFVLAPLAEIAPDLVIPGQGAVGPLLAACAAQGLQRLP